MTLRSAPILGNGVLGVFFLFRCMISSFLNHKLGEIIMKTRLSVLPFTLERQERKLRKSRLLVLVAFVFCVTYLNAAEKEKVTLEGTLVSSVCYLGGNQTGDEMGGEKHCGRKCLEGGDPGGLLTKEKQFHILVAPSLKLAPYVGQEVRITGINHDGAIAVEKAEVQKDGKWQEINMHEK